MRQPRDDCLSELGGQIEFFFDSQEAQLTDAIAAAFDLENQRSLPVPLVELVEASQRLTRIRYARRMALPEVCVCYLIRETPNGPQLLLGRKPVWVWESLWVQVASSSLASHRLTPLFVRSMRKLASRLQLSHSFSSVN